MRNGRGLALAAPRILIALAMAAPMVSQDEAQPYFSLSSSRTFGSLEKPSVALSGWQVPSVGIRVYRVKDDLEFFRRLDDPHSFGGQAPRPSGKPTLLERIHNWKRELRRNIRVSLRDQFTESPSEQLSQMFPKRAPEPGKAGKGTHYAEAPILNREQMVLSFTQPIAQTNRWGSEVVPINVTSKGVYLVEAVRGELRAYTIVMITDIVMVTKTGRERALSFVADRGTGEPVRDVSVSVMTRNGTPQSVTTNSDGLAELAVKQHTPEDLRIFAKRGDNVAVGDLSSWMFSQRERNWTGYIYTDRPVYRPGDTIHFRGILRRQATVGYQVPTGESVLVQVIDPDGKPVYQKTLKTNSNGIIHDELALERAASLGNYSVQVKAGENEMNGNFEVQEYKKPEYEVRVTADKPRVLEGDSLSTSIEARYYFGEPVKGAKVKYSVYRTRYWFPLWYDADEDAGEENPDAYADQAGEQISESEGRLDDDGKLAISVPTTVSDSGIDYRYRIEANVTDQAGREISGTGWVVATYGSFLVNAMPDRYFYQPNTTAMFQVQARDYDNKPISTAVHVELALWNWRARKTSEVKSATDVTTDANGNANASLTILEGGSYRAIARGRTPEGRTVESTTFIWVAGAGQESFWGGEQRKVQIVPDKKTYKAGEKASILIVTGRANTPVLVTVEGRDIRSERVLRSKGPTAVFEYTVSRDDEPGFFVNAQFIRKGAIYQGNKRLKVPPDDHRLKVKISTDKASYRPGQSAAYAIDVTSADGAPAANADLSLGVIDEAIYAIRRDTTPDILDFFYGLEWNSVSTENSLTYFFTGEAGKRRMMLARLEPEGKLAQIKPERLVQPKIRKLFPDTAFWAADLTTDSAGHAEAQVAFPDSLTTWRATVRGVGEGERYGGATLKTIVRKNLILRLAVPRFFVQGDEVTISGIVHNYLSNGKQARVSVELEGAGLMGANATQNVQIASRAEAKVDWRVKAETVRQIKITAQALTDEESDAIELELPVNPPGVSVRRAKSGSIRDAGSQSFTFTFPSDALAGSRSVSIRLSPSIAGSLFGALDFLTSFPYGCVEQTMSSFLPDLVVNRVAKQLTLKEPINEEELQSKISAGLDRLYGFQHADGGWGWWVTDESHPFMTAYVIAGLSEARTDGLNVNADAIDKGVAWIQKNSGEQRNFAPDLRAYMAYALALAGHPDAAALNASYRGRADLSPYGKAILGLAFEVTKDQRAASLAGELETDAKQNEMEAWWPATRDEMLDFSADVTPEASAYAVKLLSHERPKSGLLPKAALWLVNHRDEGLWWSSTKQTAMVIYGLIDYVKASNELHPNFTATVSVNGSTAATHDFKDAELNGAPEITIGESKLNTGTNQIQVSSQGQGRLYYSIAAVHYSSQPRLEKQGAISLNLLRDYFRLSQSREEGRIVYDLAPLDGPVSQGDTIAVRLTVTGSEWRYLLVEDPIPAGTEFIEKDNLYELRNKPPWWAYWFTRRELHDDRLAIFQTYFNEGQQQYFYLLKVVNPGLFHMGPARVEPMYQPGFQATTEAKTLEVR